MKNRLRIIRTEKGLSQLALSRMTGIAGNIISNIESGKIHFYPGWKRRIASALKVSTSDLDMKGGINDDGQHQ